MIEFIDQHRHRFGVEPICTVLSRHGCGIAPSTYYAAKTRPLSARRQADEQLLVEIFRVHHEVGRGVYGVRKVWHQLRREGFDVARCTVERLMRQEGLQGARRGKTFRTTRPDASARRPPDLVKRDFRASAPNELWVVDFTYVPTWSGMAFSAFVIGRVLPSHRRVAKRERDADRVAPRRARDGVMDPRAGRRACRRVDPSQRCREPIHLDSLQQPTYRCACGRVDRQRR